jgi:hypothetical protein
MCPLIRYDILRATFTATGFGNEFAEKPNVLSGHFVCDKYC